MRRRSVVAVIGLAVIGILALAQSAPAATIVGNSCSAETGGDSVNAVATANGPGEPFPAAVPSSGVITSWTFSLAIPIGPGLTVAEQLKIFRPTGVPGQLTVVGESALGPIHAGSNTFQTRIPVKPGDLLGSSTIVSAPGETTVGALYCKTSNPGDRIGVVAGNPTLGATASIVEEGEKFAQPITAAVEPDTDGDGYGDETQDRCPTDASTQGPCPAPPAPITLSASSVAKKGLVVVTVSAGGQASVTVGGTVKVGAATVKLSGGTKTVTAGALAKFTVVFPAKMKKKLKQTPPSKKLTLELSASAPGATTTAFKVKVKGQKKPHHNRGGTA